MSMDHDELPNGLCIGPLRGGYSCGSFDRKTCLGRRCRYGFCRRNDLGAEQTGWHPPRANQHYWSGLSLMECSGRLDRLPVRYGSRIPRAASPVRLKALTTPYLGIDYKNYVSDLGLMLDK